MNAAVGLGERLERELLQGAPTPQRQRFAEHQRGRCRVGVEQRPALAGECLEPHRIDVIRFDVEHVAGWTCHQHGAVGSFGAIGLERGPQTRDVDPQCVLPVFAGVAGP